MGTLVLILVCTEIVYDVICVVVIYVYYIDLVNLCMIF